MSIVFRHCGPEAWRSHSRLLLTIQTCTTDGQLSLLSQVPTTPPVARVMSLSSSQVANCQFPAARQHHIHCSSSMLPRSHPRPSSHTLRCFIASLAQHHIQGRGHKMHTFGRMRAPIQASAPQHHPTAPACFLNYANHCFTLLCAQLSQVVLAGEQGSTTANSRGSAIGGCW